MTAQELRHSLTKARHAIFQGELLTGEKTPYTQEDYIALYENRLERHPLIEKKMFSEAIAPILPLYQKQWRQANQAAALMSGESEEEPDDFEDWLMEIYDEIMNTETEAEWESFVKRFVQGARD